MDRGRRSSRNVPRQRSLLQRDWPGLRLHVPAQLPHKSSISSQISFLLFKEGLEPRSKLEQQRKQVFKADLEPLRYTRPLNHSIYIYVFFDIQSVLCIWLRRFGYICAWESVSNNCFFILCQQAHDVHLKNPRRIPLLQPTFRSVSVSGNAVPPKQWPWGFSMDGYQKRSLGF